MPSPAGTSTTRGARGLNYGLSILEALLAVGPAVLGLVALGALRHLTYRSSASTVTAIWGVVLLASFVGWGTAVNELTTPERRFDLGMRAALGVSVHLALGGVL